MRITIIIASLAAVGWMSAVAADNDKANEKKSTAQPAKRTVAHDVMAHTSSVVGGVHDFTDPKTGAGDACQGCHVPHLQALRPTTQPATTTQPAVPQQPTYEMFRIGGQRRVFEPDRYMPGATSLICLSCHDGSVATSTIGSAHSMLAGVREGFSMPDNFAWRDHPIGVPYPNDRREYNPQSFVEKKGVRLPEGRIECVSCHAPHGEGGHKSLLIMSNRRSALCLTCHIK